MARALACAFSAIALAAGLSAAQPQGPAVSQKKVRDQGEYDLFSAAAKETASARKAELLQQWKEKYPQSDFREERDVMMLQAYQALGRPKDLLAIAKDLLAANPGNMQALFWVATLVPGLELKDPADLDLGDKAGQSLLKAARPEGTKDDDWAGVRKDLHALAYREMGYTAMVRNDYPRAESEFRKSLEVKPQQAQVSSWLGVAIYRQKNTGRTSEVLYHFARAAALDPKTQGGFADPGARKEAEDYVAKAYATFHGEDPQGLVQLKTEAAAAPFPPPGFRIENINEIAIRKEAEFRNGNPQLALWLGMKKELASAAGDRYFETSLKHTAVPKLKGTIVAGKPAVNSRELLVAMDKPDVAEVTLKLDAAIKGKPAAGTQIEWEGVASGFVGNPFMLTFEVRRASLWGLKLEVSAGKKSAAGEDGGARKKK